jgi:hypothetical protein
MATKKPPKAVPLAEAIHFRPGEELGRLIADTADQLALSRGECAKRLVGLAIRNMDLTYYGLADRLGACMYGGTTFDECCHHLHVAIATEAAEQGELSAEDKYRVAKLLVDQHELLHGKQRTAEETKVEVKIVLLR